MQYFRDHFRLTLLICFSIFAFSSSLVSAAESSPQTFTLDGQLLQKDSSLPLVDSNVSISIQILDPTKKCVLYEEQQVVNTLASNGYFNVQVGSSVGSAKRTVNDSGHSMTKVFQNSTAFAARSAAGETCPSSTYTPQASDTRYFRLTVTPSTTGVADTLLPDTLMDSVPNALVAQTVQGLDRSGILQVNSSSNLTQTNLEGLLTGTGFVDLTALIAGTSEKYVRANTANGTGVMPSLATDPTSGLAPGQIWYDSAGGVIKFRNGSGTQTLSGGTITGSSIISGTIGGTTAVNTSGSITTTGSVVSSSVSANSANVRSLILTNTDTPNHTITINPATGMSGNFVFTWPLDDGTANQVLTTDGAGVLSWASAGGTYADSNARAAISGAAPLSYNSTTGTMSLGTVDVANGGTGATALPANQLVLGNGTSAVGAVPAGTSGQMLVSQGASAPTWANVTVPATTGAAGTILRSDGTNYVSTTATYPATATTTGSILRADGTNFVGTTASYPNTIADQGLLFGSGANVVGQVTVPITQQVLLSTVTTGAPVWSTGSANTFMKGGAGAVTWSAVDLASNDVTGTLTVGKGGTGATTLTSGSLLVGAGTGAVTSIAGGTTGNVLYATGASTWGSATPDTAGLVDKSSTQTISGAKTLTNSFTLNAQNAVRFADADSTNYVEVRSPATVGTNVTLTLPDTDGTANQVLTTDGAGILTWTSPGSAYSDANARAAISGAAPLSYNSTTGAMSLGTVEVANGGTGTTTGSITGTGALTFAAGGTNQNVTLTPSGTGYTVLGGNVGIGTTNPQNRLQIQATDSSVLANVVNSSSTTARYPGISVSNYTSGFGGAPVVTMSSYNGTSGAATAIGPDQSAGIMIFQAYDGSAVTDIARIYGTTGPNFSAGDQEGILRFFTGDATSYTEKLRINHLGNVGIGTISPTATLHLKAGTAAANTAPLKLTSGVNLTTPENGAMEYDGSSFYLTTGGTRYPVPLAGGASTFTTVGAGVGSNSAPSLSFSGDADTGFYNASSNNTISVAVGGANIFDFSSAGLVSPTTGGGSVTTANGSAATPTFSFAGDTDTGWYRFGADTMSASTAGFERMRIGSTGNVGIGTAPTTSRLAVSGTVEATDATVRIGLQPTGGIGYIGTITSHPVGIYTANGAVQSTFNTSGDLGIGATDPNIHGRLTVSGTRNVAGSGYGGAIHVHSMTLNDSATAPSGTRSVSAGVLLNAPTLTSTNTSVTSAGAANIYVNGVPTAGTNTTITNTYGVRVATSAASATTTNAYGLDVAAPTGATNNYAATFTGGNVGIGTTSPSAPLTVSAAGGLNAVARIQNSTAGSVNHLALIVDANDATNPYGLNASSVAERRILAVADGGTLRQAMMFSDANSATETMFGLATSSNSGTTWLPRLVVQQGGNVGIGTASPAVSLDLGSTTDALRLPNGTTGQQPGTPSGGMLRYNTNSGTPPGWVEFYNGIAWVNLATTSSGNFTGVGSVTGSGNLTLSGVTTATSSVIVGNTTSSIGSASGALVVNGGIGVAGDIFTGASINAGSTISAVTSVRAPAMIGSTSASADLTLDSTSHATKGNIILAPTGGNVGIGTTSPTMSLEIQGGASTTGSNGIKILSTNDSGGNNSLIEVTGKRSDANGAGTFAGTLALSKNRTDAATASASQLGRVIFGANHTNGSLSNVLYTSAIGGISEGTFADASTMPTGLAFYTGSAGVTTSAVVGQASAVGSERMRIDASGRVGIGTNSPVNLLDVRSVNQTSTVSLENSSSTAARFPSVGVTNFTGGNGGSPNFLLSTARGSRASPAAVLNNDYLGSLSAFGQYDTTLGNVGNGASVGFQAEGNFTSSSYPAAIYFATAAAGSTSTDERMRISSSGKVGIGTTSPDEALVVRSLGNSVVKVDAYTGTSATLNLTSDTYASITAPTSMLGFGTGGSERMRIDATGYVGIGTTSPTSVLDVNSSTTSSIRSINTTALGASSGGGVAAMASTNPSAADQRIGNFLFGAYNTGSGVYRFPAGIFGYSSEAWSGATNQGTYLTFETTPTAAGNARAERVRIDPAGNVGIGTTSPAAKLDVAGQTRSVNSSGAAQTNGSAAIDWNNGNAQTMSVACTTTTFTNMLDGGTYILAVSETGTTTCTFSQAGLTFYFSPANGARTSGQRTVYSFQRIGTDVYVSWIKGFQ